MNLFNFQNIKHNTYPFFIHCPSRSKFYQKDFLKLKNFFDNSIECPEIEQVPDISVITWNNSNNKSIFEKSCDYFGIKYYTLGKGIVDWNNLLKIPLSLDFANNCKSKYLIGVDGFDAVALKPLDLGMIKSLQNHKIIYNKTTEESWPRLSIFYGSDYCLNHLNSGAWLAETSFIREFYSHALDTLKDHNSLFNKIKNIDLGHKTDTSDQTLIKIAGNNYQKDIGLDHKYEIFNIIGSTASGTNGLILDF